MQYELSQNRAERPRKLSGILLHFLEKEKAAMSNGHQPQEFSNLILTRPLLDVIRLADITGIPRVPGWAI